MKMSDKIRAVQAEVDDLKFAVGLLRNKVLELQQHLAESTVISETDDTLNTSPG